MIITVTVSHYATLQLGGENDRVTTAEIRRAYHRLILLVHPDKLVPGTVIAGGAGSDDTVRASAEELNAAYAVLGDEERRKEYDDHLLQTASQSHLRESYTSVCRGMLPTDTLLCGVDMVSFAQSIDLSAFVPHSDAHDDDDEEPVYYSHPCRCSGEFIITTVQLESGAELVQCDGCSERCRVEYQVVVEG